MFGRTLVIVNPAARSGKAAEVAAHAALVFDRIQKTSASTHETDVPLHRGTQRRNENRTARRTPLRYGSCARRRRANKRSSEWAHEPSDQPTPNARSLSPVAMVTTLLEPSE